MKTKRYLSIILCALCLFGCGGGGGGGEDSGTDSGGAAIIDLMSEPAKVDTGSRVHIRIDVQDVPEDGIVLKVRYPMELQYQRGSGSIRTNETIPIFPNFNTVYDKYRYTVFILPRSALGDDNFARLDFDVQTLAPVEDGRIEVDADISDPNIPDSQKFIASDAKFTPEVETRVDVE